jgi:chromosome condensin MukBEF complex kleisin-like MukF subunit
MNKLTPSQNIFEKMMKEYARKKTGTEKITWIKNIVTVLKYKIESIYYKIVYFCKLLDIDWDY